MHRDIKPNNVVVSPNGENAYLIDFGICQYADGELTLLTTQEAFGNPAFAAPECFLGREEEPGPPCDIYSLGKLFYWMISQGNYINRERLSPAVLARITTKSELVRFYLARLVRGTVAENPKQRWMASRLLEEIHSTRQLLNRLRKYESRGQIVLTDGFWVEDSFSRSGSRSATTPNRGNPPADGDIGEAFEVPAGHDVYLDTITLALQFRAGRELNVWVVPDVDGRADYAKILDSLTINGSSSCAPGIESISSQQRPVLRQGRRYWVVLSVPQADSEVALWAAPLEFGLRPRLIAERLDGNEWQVAEASGGYAIRVTGRPVNPMK